MLRSVRGIRLTVMTALRISPPPMLPTNSTMSVTSGDFLKTAAAAVETRDVSSSVPPGGSSMSSSALAKSSGGMNAVGMMAQHANDSKKNTTPTAMVFQRLAEHQRSSDK